MDRKTSHKLCDTVRDEQARAFEYLGKSGKPHLYYLSHLIRDERVWRIQARYGALAACTSYRRRDCLADVRVGSHRRDQVQDGGLGDNSTEDESYEYVDLPWSGAADGLRHGIWRLTDARYREAQEAFLRKKADEITYLDQHLHLPSFERREPVIDRRWRKLPTVDEEYWKRFVLRASKLLKQYPDIKTSSVEFQARQSVKTFVNTEGCEIIRCADYWSVDCYLWLLSKNGNAFPWAISHYTANPDELPNEKSFHAEIRRTVGLLRKLADAPVVRSYSGPVLLEPRPAGLLMHEALGHRLEGNRLLASGEGQTFRDSRGRVILPEFLTMYDDASVPEFEGKTLVGHYDYDDEGTAASRADLIENGKLKGFLTARAGISKRHKSNGHARSRYWQRAISRMANTFIEARDGLPDDELRAQLVEEIKRQGLPYGIRILHADGGETATEGYNFQAFLGEINLAVRVFPDGKEELIRGVNFVGTPLNAVRSIIAAGKRREVDNAHCGAESGYVPVSTISPALLVSHLELQAKVSPPFTQYTYPIPWDERGENQKSTGKGKLQSSRKR